MIPRALSIVSRTPTRTIQSSPIQESECTPAPHYGKTGLVVQPVTIEKLPDEVLLEIFIQEREFALKRPSSGPWEWEWKRLAHVCQRWRSLVFASPRRLELRLYYTYRKSIIQDSDLCCWPPFPIAIFYPQSPPSETPDEDNIIAALKHHNRVCEINFALTSTLLEKSALLMQEPFPALEQLRLESPDSATGSLILPSAFLGGSAPRLREIHLDGITFPALSQLLLSSTPRLVSLQLEKIPYAESFSPEVLVNGLSASTQLQCLKLHFIFPDTLPEQGDARQLSNSPSYINLSSLTEFQFKGTSGYLEVFVARLDAPSLQQFGITFFDQSVFEIPQLSRFIGRTERLKSPRKASLYFSVNDVTITQLLESPYEPDPVLRIRLSCRDLGRKVASIAHVCRQLFPFLLNVERLDIRAFRISSYRGQRHQSDPTQWLELFHSFQGVKTLEVTTILTSFVASALEHAARGINQDVFPALCDLHLDGPRESLSASIVKFTVARQFSGRPVSVRYSSEGDQGI